MSYSKDFRKKVLLVKEKEKLTFEETAKRFAIAKASIQNWIKNIEPCSKRNKPATKINMEELKKDLVVYPDAYLYERAKRLNVSKNCVFFAIRRLGVSYKKNSSSSESRQRKTGNF
jgi:transposase